MGKRREYSILERPLIPTSISCRTRSYNPRRFGPLNLQGPRFQSQKPEKELSDHVTSSSSSMPDQPLARVVSRCDLRKVTLHGTPRACSTRMEKTPSDHLKGSDQSLQATPDSDQFDSQEQEKLSSDVTTSMPSSIAVSSPDQVQRCDSSITSTALEKKKKKKKKKIKIKKMIPKKKKKMIKRSKAIKSTT